jgi:hypothetical protein
LLPSFKVVFLNCITQNQQMTILFSTVVVNLSETCVDGGLHLLWSCNSYSTSPAGSFYSYTCSETGLTNHDWFFFP